MQKPVLTAIIAIAVLLASGCSENDPEEVRAAILASSDPSSDVLYAIEAVEAANDACLLDQGIEPVPPGSRISNMVLDGEVSIQGLPAFRHLDGEVVGYATELEERHIAHRQAYKEHEEPHDDHALNDGWDDPDENVEEPSESVPVVSFEVPIFGSFGVLLDGCVGQSLNTVVPAELLESYLIGTTLLDYLAYGIHAKALDRASGLRAWRDCMMEQGFEVKSPFTLLKRYDHLPEHLAPVDAQCRQRSGLEEAYLSQVDRELRNVPSEAIAALEELDRVAREIRLAQ